MPDITQIRLIQWCVVWIKLDTRGGKFGKVRVKPPINVRCRWLIGDNLSVSQDEDHEILPRSVPVSRDIPLGSYVWGPGKVDDLPSSPTYWEVVGRQKIPDLKGRHPAYRITLQRASETLLEVVT